MDITHVVIVQIISINNSDRDTNESYFSFAFVELNAMFVSLSASSHPLIVHENASAAFSLISYFIQSFLRVLS